MQSFATGGDSSGSDDLKPHALRNRHGYLICGLGQGMIDMVGIHRRDSSGAMTEQPGNGQLTVIEFMSDGRLAVPKRMGGYVFKLRGGHHPIEAFGQANQIAVSAQCRKDPIQIGVSDLG